MAKLYFRYGTVNSAKSLNLLAVAHNYDTNGCRIMVMKPAVDDRWGVGKVVSRTGLERDLDHSIGGAEEFDEFLSKVAGLDCILVDEAQFLAPPHINTLKRVTARKDIPVICYGLRADFRGELF